ncbi:MAG: hypothetical protein A2358_03420 [Candidatus Staskawiczbacteria bacterium RIFOXYB1_FULL_37_44]|uniref:DUF916 domain-containing protein n=1 Tax=Candidatus Staskawiczbacteria bacterium RIFOXYB1_FULL_37_44 TaxID=1802223 RepID=A0A1G2IUT3_9BACT|nr:MAG: hypothetical protein A2358_03420 [Candidatus Staskawiczbacteria bacterium RIFOXYB1_FULL_37_44]OGZ83057.1 MAG: hypothetical protein A2416_01325 [Candidatus Staskawiczbacteria bacterium RIFOXYC1_FULL_37_52]OGZ87552.1 MAG: hypothetical protein A2444_00385 [Candidatus Staskawiczbacteria bacterium RIFOXYC2_FULL_37_19]OGZ90158.1 MAG: hypothetical protein A2581_01960 [Candidatus Staskawiczbacteria bacterium RIFOXYD1_FULL_37_110]
MKKRFFLFALLLFFLSFSSALAASDTSVVIQPAKIEITASPDQKLSRSFSVINRSNFFVKLKLTVKDYKQVSEDGKLEFYDAKNEQASLWLVPQYLEIGLKPLETKTVGIVVDVPKDFSGGGHYGAILFQSVGNSENINTNNFGELVLLTVTGSNIKTSATIRSVDFSTGLIQQGKTADFNFKIKNDGNTHFDAQAKLVVKDWLGKEIGNYNIGSLTVYPKTSRLFKWRWNNTPFMGIYKAEVLLSNSTVNAQFTSIDGKWFIIFPWQMAVLFLLLALAIFALVKYRKNIVSLTKSLFNLKLIIGA